jgi:hypothetical protein
MLYYVRQDKNATIDGPFSIDQLDHGLTTGALSPRCLASGDIGDRLESLQKFRRCDWFQLSEIPNLQHLYPPPTKEVAATEPPTWRRQLLNLFLTAMMIYVTANRHSWWAWASAVAALLQAVGLIQTTLQRNRTSG